MKNIYYTKKWEDLRKAVLMRDGYICQWTKRYSPIPKQATCVHHIFPVQYYPEFAYCSWNCISLCDEAHNHMHYRKLGMLSKDGIILLKKTARKQHMKNLDELLMRMGI